MKKISVYMTASLFFLQACAHVTPEKLQYQINEETRNYNELREQALDIIAATSPFIFSLGGNDIFKALGIEVSFPLIGAFLTTIASALVTCTMTHRARELKQLENELNQNTNEPAEVRLYKANLYVEKLKKYQEEIKVYKRLLLHASAYALSHMALKK